MAEESEIARATNASENGALLLATGGLAAACVLAGGGLLWRSRAAACLPGTACARPGDRRFTTLTLALTAILALLGYAIA